MALSNWNQRQVIGFVALAAALFLPLSSSRSLAQGLVFDFRGLAPGALPGGFLTLENNGITALFSANGTTISQDSVSGQNALHTATFVGQIGMEFNIPVRQVTFGFAPSIPGPTHSMKIAGYYTANFSIVGINSPVTQNGTYIYNAGRNVWGLLLENVDEGFALTSVSIDSVPEPGSVGLMVVGLGALFLARRRMRLEAKG